MRGGNLGTGTALDRRGFLGATTALGAGALLERAGGASAHGPSSGRRGGLPRRGHFVIRDAVVLTMDEDLGDLARGDVHVRDGRIVGVGRGLRASGAGTIDGRGTIVMPGLIDTHWHLWNTIARSMAGDTPENAYFALVTRLAPLFEPVDTYRAVRLSAADALSSGITTIHDWSHNIRDPRYADVSLRALDETGIRARFSYGWSWGAAQDQTLDLADLRRVHDELSGSELLSLGLAGRGPGSATLDVIRTEWGVARELGIPVTVHVGVFNPQDVRILAGEGLLGPDVQLVHAVLTPPADLELIADSGSPLSLSPWTETLVGFGFPAVDELRAAGIPISLSVDTAAISGTADMFSVMRLLLAVAHGRARAEIGLTTRQAVEMATIEGARGLGLADVTGSLTPGKRADLIMLRTGDINIAPVTDPVAAVALAAGPQNVDTVVVDGRILKRKGALVALDTREIVADAARSMAAVAARSGQSAPSAARVAAARAPQLAALGCCAV
jgi:cytosine/adenosine deaminase-related metal-dependent hydrolase